MSDPLTLLCVHPHPDDESIACGGVLAATAHRGMRPVVVTCTGGEEGENLSGIDLGDEDLISHRRRELADALAALGVVDHHYLGYRDSGMIDTPGNAHLDSFHAADLEEAAIRLAAIIRAERPQVVVSDDASGTYGHPDHVKANRVTIRAVELAADADAPVDGEPWPVAKRYVFTLGRERLLATNLAIRAAGLPSPFGDDDAASADDLPFGTPDEWITTEIDVAPWLDRKRAALAAHRSQIGPESFFLNVPSDLASEVFGVEQFVLEAGVASGIAATVASSRERGGPVEHDLFAGLRGVAGPDAPHAGDYADVLHGRSDRREDEAT